MFARTHEIAGDAGTRQAASARQRFCAATGSVKPADELIRFVVGPDSTVVPDVKGRLPGRGIWITATRQALEAALARNAFARSFRRDVRADADLVERTEHLLAQAALDALAVCRKAGRVAVGFTKVEAVLARDRVAVLLHAVEAASDGVQKLAAALRRCTDAERICVFRAFTSTQLDLALGRSNVIHAALLTGRESETFVTRALRLERFRKGPVRHPAAEMSEPRWQAEVANRQIGGGESFGNRELDRDRNG
jgi:predicted RNA-binding protein YlxR (DUF448 family)